MNFSEKPKDISALIDEINAAVIDNRETYTNGEATPTFKDWLPTFNELNITEETLPLLKEIYDTYIYNVPLPKTPSVEDYISKLEARKQNFQDRLDDFKTRLAQGEIKPFALNPETGEPIYFNPQIGEIESEETSLSTINQIQGKINILLANRK